MASSRSITCGPSVVAAPAQPVRDHTHHLQGEIRRQFHEAQETLFVDSGERAVRGGHRGRTTRTGINEGHLAEYATGRQALDHRAVDLDVHGTFDDCIHAIPSLSGLEDRLAFAEGADVGLATQEFHWRHELRSFEG